MSSSTRESRGCGWGPDAACGQTQGSRAPSRGMALPRDAQAWPDLHQRPGTNPSTNRALRVCVRPDGGCLRMQWPDAQFAWSTLTHAHGPNQGLRASLLVSTHSDVKDTPFVLCSHLARDPSLTLLPLASPSVWVCLPHSCSSSSFGPISSVDPSKQPQLNLFCIPTVPEIHRPRA